MMSSVEQLLRAAKYLEMQDRHHQYGGLSPPDSPVTTSDNHLIQFNGDVITNTAPSRIDARNVINILPPFLFRGSVRV
ncbi:hypothetical protein HA402_011463 [Bradysia odoriphaga]|nr:hypothetical protein HA402_011463 [Bradysia odoriphaga]